MSEVFAYGVQIAEGLDRAHRAGIVHRDLKPGNIVLTKSGAKLLDFGLAKSGADTDSDCETDALTQEGTLLGTVQYMAPEQVEGREADARSDIFAYGAILYEMVTGKRAFQADSRASLIAAILTSEPALLAASRSGSGSGSASSRNLARIERVVRPCLEKDPDRRWQNALDVANELRRIAEGSADTSALPDVKGLKTLRRWKLAFVMACVIGAGSLAAVFWLARASASMKEVQPSPPRAIPDLTRLTEEPGYEDEPTISPDGASFAYAARPEGMKKDIFFRRIGGENAINLTKDSPGDNTTPAFSPDGQWIAFRSERDGGGIFIVGATGESVRRLTDFGYWPAWSPDGKSLVVTAGDPPSFAEPKPRELRIIDVATGAQRKIFDKGVVFGACWSPSGHRVAVTMAQESKGKVIHGLWTIPVAGGNPVQVSAVRRGFPHAWTRDGIWYLAPAGGTPGIWRVRVDEATGESLGEPELVMQSAPGFGDPSPTADGRRVLAATGFLGQRIVRWDFDPSTGRITPQPQSIIVARRGLWLFGGPSPDSKWLAAAFLNPAKDIALVRTDSGEIRRLTNDPLVERICGWAPDSSKLYFTVAPNGSSELWSIRPDGIGRELVQAALPEGEITNALPSPDGHTLIVGAGKLEIPYLIDTRMPQSERKPVPLPAPGEGLTFFPGDWSPDGRWLLGRAYRKAEPSPDLYLFDFERRTYRKLLDLKFPSVYSWLPDSRRIVAMKTSGGPIHLIDRESGRVTSVGSVTGLGLTNLRMSRDGRSLFGNTSFVETDIWMLEFGAKP